VVSDGEMSVVGLERVVGTTEETTDVESVILASVKVGVISNGQRKVILDIRALQKGSVLKFLVILQYWVLGIFCKDILEITPRRAMKWTTESSKSIQGLLRKHISVLLNLRTTREPISLCKSIKV
jgi:hypothetical protein